MKKASRASQHATSSPMHPFNWRALVPMGRSLWQPFLFCILINLLLVVSLLAIPSFLMYFVDHVLPLETVEPRNRFLELFGFLGIMGFILYYVRQSMIDRVYLRLSTGWICHFFWHILHLPTLYYARHTPSEIANRIPLNDAFAELIAEKLALSLFNLFTAVIVGGMLFFFNPLIAFLVLLINCLLLIFSLLIEYRHKKGYAVLQQETQQFDAQLAETLQSLETVKVTGLELLFHNRLSALYAKSVNSNYPLMLVEYILVALQDFIFLASMGIVLIVGSWQVTQGTFSLGMLLATQQLAFLFSIAIRSLGNPGESLKLLRRGMRHVHSIYKTALDPLEQPVVQVGAAQVSHPEKLKGFVRMENVAFKYAAKGPNILHAINLDLCPGKTVALIGKTSSGKSTLTHVLSTLYPPSEGSLYFDDRPADSYPSQVLRRSIGYVEQHAKMLHDTLRYNLTLLDSTVTEEELVRAAKDACIHDEIMRRKGGYDLIVEPNGTNLSSGQKQRLEIARVLARNPSILILDESFSALNIALQNEILRNIQRRGCATLIVTYQLSTIQSCDEILVLGQGASENASIVKRATPQDLDQLLSEYKDLIET